MALRTGIVASAAAFVSLLGSCTFEPRPPDGARILCSGGTACPAGWTCVEAIGECIRSDLLDVPAPALAGPAQLSAALLKKGAATTLRFQVDQELGAEPVVLLEAGTPLSLSTTREGGTTYVASYVATGVEPQGRSCPLTIELVGRTGTRSGRLAVGELRFDFEAPTLVPNSAAVSPSLVRRGVPASVRFTVSEPLGAPPKVQVGAGEAALVASSGEAHEFVYTPGDLDLEGEALVSAVLTDEAGNTSGTLTVGAVEFDYTPPALELLTPLPSEPLGLGEVVSVNIQLAEPVDPAVALELASSSRTVAMSRVSLSPVTETHLAFVQPGDDGDWEVRVPALADRAGNLSAPFVVGHVTLDTQPPALASAPAVKLPSRPLREGDRLEVAFSPAEPLSGEPLVRLNGAALRLEPPSGEHAYSFARTVSDPAQPPEQAGTWAVMATLVDRAGNTRELSLGSVVYDFTPPRIASASVTYQPAPTNPLNAVTEATAGTTVTIIVLADEQLDPSTPATLTLACGATSIARDAPAKAQTAASATFEVTVPAGAPDGACTPTVSWRDLAGNLNAQATFATPEVRVKTSTPTLEVAQNLVRYVRSPWGNMTAENLGTFTIPAGPYFALAPSEPLENRAYLAAAAFRASNTLVARVRLWADGNGSSLVGTMTANPDGTWPRQLLARLDTPVLYATGLDWAGNESAPVRIENAEWVATTAASALAAGVHLLRPVPLASESRTQEATPTLSPAAEGADGRALLARAQTTWRERVFAGGPSARSGHAMAYDSARGRVVLFGGEAGAYGVQDTWEWDGALWSERTPMGDKPTARSRHAMAYDSARGRVVLFGGFGDGARQDTWEWDGVRWVDRTPAGDKPEARWGAAMAYDSARRRVVLFGGWSASGGRQDTWEWDGAQWTARTPTGSSPTARLDHAMAYDSARGRVVLFGGNTAGAGSLQDTWEWDGAAWHACAPAGPQPGARGRHAMAYDALRGRVVLLGGQLNDYYSGSSTLYDETWEWDGSSWVDRTPSTGRPSPRYGHALAFDQARRQVVAFGGVGSGLLADTWGWDGTIWTSSTSSSGRPSPREGHALVFDSGRRRALLYGGFTPSGVAQDTWEYDGAGWTQRAPAASPGHREGHAMVYDSARDRVVFFGGARGTRFQDTWEWDGTNWTERFPAAKPGPRAAHAMAYDRTRGRVVLFGGISDYALLGDTWEWDGTNWVERTPAGAGPSPRGAVAMAYDEARKRVVLFGGYDGAARGDTWEWDGTSWLERSPAGPIPCARQSHAMAFDSARSRVILFAGFTGSDHLQDAWEWDGTSWADRTPSGDKPALRRGHAMVYDGARGRLLLFGGYGPAGPAQDTWESDSSPSRQPAIQFDASWMSAGFEPAAIAGLRIRAHCGGRFAPFATGSVGSVLLGWGTGGPGQGPGGWLELAANDQVGIFPAQPHLPLPPAALLDSKALSAEQARPFVTERDRLFALQCRPAGTSGAGDAEVALDYLEVRVRYVTAAPAE